MATTSAARARGTNGGSLNASTVPSKVRERQDPSERGTEWQNTARIDRRSTPPGSQAPVARACPAALPDISVGPQLVGNRHAINRRPPSLGPQEAIWPRHTCHSEGPHDQGSAIAFVSSASDASLVHGAPTDGSGEPWLRRSQHAAPSITPWKPPPPENLGSVGAAREPPAHSRRADATEGEKGKAQGEWPPWLAVGKTVGCLPRGSSDRHGSGVGPHGESGAATWIPGPNGANQVTVLRMAGPPKKGPGARVHRARDSPEKGPGVRTPVRRLATQRYPEARVQLHRVATTLARPRTHAHLCRDDAVVVPDAQIRGPGSAVRRPPRCRGPSGARREATTDPTSPETSPTRESSAGRENPAGGAATKGVPARRDGRPAGKSSSRTGRFASINLIPGEIVHPRPRKRHTRSGRSRQAPRLRNPPAALEAGRLASQIQPRTAAFRVAIGRPGDVRGPPIAELRRPPHALANGARHHEINAQPMRLADGTMRLADGTGDVDGTNLERNNRVDGTNHVLLPSKDPFEHTAQRQLGAGNSARLSAHEARAQHRCSD
ncbi:hypothetical protein HPB47_010738 [Ixodes persulcatus]|uniref:Uncharacterized protein n=1 Tax=Ixodes persulcatus TaxID=34615 RepID=A0AC60NYB1_IXOPE|nr:hypothetical protein HPB47_010738 [Ixodes persulcatus]